MQVGRWKESQSSFPAFSVKVNPKNKIPPHLPHVSGILKISLKPDDSLEGSIEISENLLYSGSQFIAMKGYKLKSAVVKGTWENV